MAKSYEDFDGGTGVSPVITRKMRVPHYRTYSQCHGS
jgi:hypothetical protein